ncbi:hypothetical protein [Ammoniphilus sp. YIM 78166]|uniref:hypothetical protein n=1 Tax=Ammoniphilus sp. YIM 78166 TaxID=1644106 RepID=UPI001430984C|nr:hypothetical protein [Ammoniphilus sp. YIM 78166]
MKKNLSKQIVQLNSRLNVMRQEQKEIIHLLRRRLRKIEKLLTPGEKASFKSRIVRFK